MMYTVELSKLQIELEDACKITSARLRAFPKLSNGLTPDEVKTGGEYIQAKQDYNKAFAALRSFNALYAKQLRKA